MAVLSSEDRAFWEEHGYVVIRDAAPRELIQDAAKAVWDFIEMDADNRDSWYPRPTP